MFHHRITVSSALYFAVTLTILSLSLLWLAQPVAHAQEQPDALGSISGMVRNEQGNPLPNIEVTINIYTGDYLYRTVTTDAQGIYRFLSVPPGVYQLKFSDPVYAYAETYYGGSAFADSAELVTVNGNTVTDIDVILFAGGTLAVEFQTTVPLTDTFVDAVLFRRLEAGQWAWYRTANLFPSLDTPIFLGLPSDDYGLCLYMSDNSYFGLFQECYDNMLPLAQGEIAEDATTIAITSGSATTVSMTLGDISQLSGIVQTPEGTPLSGIKVTLLGPFNNPQIVSNREFRQDVPMTQTGATGGGYPNVAFTDQQGNFRFKYLASGKYSLQLIDPSGNYLSSYYNQTFDFQQAEQIEINAQSRLTLTLKMPLSARITGSVLMADGGPAPYTSFNLFRHIVGNPGYPEWSLYSICEAPNCLRAEYSQATGVYTITDLIAGTYHLGVSVLIGNPDLYVGEYYGGTNEADAADIVLATGETRGNINFILGEDQFDGEISGTVTANEVPQAEIEVGLFRSVIDSGGLPFVYIKTDTQGRYHFEGLPYGSYKVGFRDPKGRYATVYSNGEYFFINAPSYEINGSTIISQVNTSLTIGASIRGHIHSSNRKPAFGYGILVYSQYHDSTLGYFDISTDAEGRYEITGLPPGIYLIATKPDYLREPYIPQLYYPSTQEQNFAQRLEVKPGDLLENIDIWFDASPGALLPLIGSGKEPVE
jgi:hypothetical protein